VARIHVNGPDYHSADAGANDRVGARTGLTGGGTRFEGHVKGGVLGKATGNFKAFNLGVWPACSLVKRPRNNLLAGG
jgi:hypothetical protein